MKQLSTRQICFFFIAFLPITKLFTLPSVLATFAEEDMWISALFNSLLDIGTLVALIFTCKKAKISFYQMLEGVIGKIGSKIVIALYFVYFILKGILPINEQKDYVEFTLYTLLPTTFYFFPFFIVALYCCSQKLRVVGRVSDIMWIISLIGLSLLLVLSISNADFSAILPIGARGFSSIFKASFNGIPWFGDSLYLLFFAGEFAYEKKDGLKIFASYVLGVLIVIFFMIIFYSIFTSIAHRQRFALTEISKYTTVINNTGRFDYLGILLILLSNFFALSTPIYFASRTLEYICNFKKKWIAPLIVVTIQLAISIFLYQYFFSIENFIVNYASYFFLIMANVLPILTLLITKTKKKETNYEYQKS